MDIWISGFPPSNCHPIMTLSSLHVGLQKMESSYAGGVELGEETEVSVKSVEQLEFIDLI